MSVVAVLCYRHYTREGKRVTSHSLLLEGIKLPEKMAADGDYTVLILIVKYFYSNNYYSAS